MEVLLEFGYGYSVSEQIVNRLPQGFVALDAIFMPVQKVNFLLKHQKILRSQKLKP
jgi:DNA-directed RNA polymerase alpha subunit